MTARRAEDDDEEGPSHDVPMTLFDHLEELRKRVMRIVLYLVIGFGIAWYFRNEIWSVIVVPIHEVLVHVGGHLQTTELSEGFQASFKVCAVVAIAIASPGVLWEIWGFVSRGLHEHEKRPVRIYVPVAMFLFLEGVIFYYFFVQPPTLEWLVNFQKEVRLIGGGTIPIEQAIKLTDAVGFFLGMSLVIGIVFELPLVMIFLQKLGIVSWRSYVKYRRHFLMGALVVTAILTPSPDAFTLGMCMVPVVALYEGGILVCWLSRKKDDVDEEDDDDDEG